MTAIVCGPGPVTNADRATIAEFAAALDAAAGSPLAGRGLLSALAIAYARIGVHDRAARLADSAAHVGRPLASTAELTAEEAGALRRHLPRCSPDTCRSTTAVAVPWTGDRDIQTPTEGAAPAASALGAAGTAPDPSGSGHGYAGPDAQPQVSPSRSHTGEGEGPGASDVPAGPLTTAGHRPLLMANGRPNPTGTGRYCPPKVCWCGRCAWWTPAPPPNYAAAIAKLAEDGAR